MFIFIHIFSYQLILWKLELSFFVQGDDTAEMKISPQKKKESLETFMESLDFFEKKQTSSDQSIQDGLLGFRITPNSNNTS